MLCPLYWDDDNWRSMFHTVGMFYHALSVVMRRWQLTEHESYLRDILPCSDGCHETMSTDGACFIPKGWITMLWPLSWDDDKWRSMIHTLRMNDHALTVVMRRWQLTEHFSLRYETCSVSCHLLTTTVRAWLWNSEFGIQNSEFGVQNSEFGIQNSEFRIQNYEVLLTFKSYLQWYIGPILQCNSNVHNNPYFTDYHSRLGCTSNQ